MPSLHALLCDDVAEHHKERVTPGVAAENAVTEAVQHAREPYEYGSEFTV